MNNVRFVHVPPFEPKQATGPFNGFGSWTLKNAPRARALEPDECYSLSLGRPTRPDLAIEVVFDPESQTEAVRRYRQALHSG